MSSSFGELPLPVTYCFSVDGPTTPPLQLAQLRLLQPWHALSKACGCREPAPAPAHQRIELAEPGACLPRVHPDRRCHLIDVEDRRIEQRYAWLAPSLRQDRGMQLRK